MIFTVYANMAEEVSKRLDKLAKKAARYEVPFSYTVSAEYPKTINVFDGFDRKTDSYRVAAVDFDVACETLIKATRSNITVYRNLNGYVVKMAGRNGACGKEKAINFPHKK